MNHKTYYLILFTITAFLSGCKSLHKTGLCTCESKSEVILGVYQRDTTSLKSMSFIAVGSYPYEIELKVNHLIISTIKIKDDGGGYKSTEGKAVKYGEWRRLGDTLYLKTQKQDVSEELYLISDKSLISLDKKPQTTWTK